MSSPKPGPETPRTTRRTALFAAVALLATLLAAEALWRALAPQTGHADRVAHVRQSLDYLRPCAEVIHRGGVPHIVGLDQAISGGSFTVPVDRRPGTVRIAVVGESTGTMIGGAMREHLDSIGDHDRVELLNCAQPGSALEHAERRAAEVLDYAPDLMIVVFGHNTMMTHFRTDTARLRTIYWLLGSRLISDAAAAIAGTPMTAPVDRATRLDAFMAWARKLAEQALARGTTPVFVTVASNYWFPPAATVEVASNPEYLEARLLHATGEVERAVAALRALVAKEREPLWHFQLGVWLARLGEAEEAHRHLQSAIDEERRQPDRAGAAVNPAIRALGGIDGVIIHDSAARIAEAARDGVPGWSEMRDNCHPDQAHVTIDAAALIELALRQREIDSQEPSRPIERYQPTNTLKAGLSAVALWMNTPDDGRSIRPALAAARLVENALLVAPREATATIDEFLAELVGTDAPASPRRRGELLSAIANGYWAVGMHERAAEINAAARRTGAGAAWVQLGLLRLAAGRPSDAQAAFSRALELEPGRKDAAYFLARTSAAPQPSSAARAELNTPPPSQ